jgi:membrane-bound metal-dependent hydrolase YbcI (DUF457 family)
MAGFRMHVTVSTLCGIAYGLAAKQSLGHSPETALLAAGVTAVSGMLPDLDSDSGRPVREMSSFAGSAIPLLAIPRLTHCGLSMEGVYATLGMAYFFIRFGGKWFLQMVAVHRGMFHSVPAMLIAGLAVYLAYGSDNQSIRLVLAAGAMIGFFSHLVLDEIYSVDFNGLRIKLNSFAGSAIKFVSPSIPATIVCYLILGGLLWLAYHDFNKPSVVRDLKMQMPKSTPHLWASR